MNNRSLRSNSTVSKVYNVEGTKVLVTWREFSQKDKGYLHDRALIFFPGWPLRAESKSIQELSKELANNSGLRTFIIHTRSEQIIPDSIYLEMHAVCKFLAEQELKYITLVGYSQGSIKAIDTIVLLQEMNPTMHTEGLILMVPVGLNDFHCGTLIRSYIWDFFITTPLVILREIFKKHQMKNKLLALVEIMVLASKAFFSFFYCILREMMISHLRYLSRFRNEVREIAKKSPYLDQIRVPIILIQGVSDLVSDQNKILAQIKVQAQKVGLQDQSEKALISYKDLSPQLLKKYLFSQSSSIKLVNAQKLGSHSLPIFRSKTVARASLYLLRKSLS